MFHTLGLDYAAMRRIDEVLHELRRLNDNIEAMAEPAKVANLSRAMEAARERASKDLAGMEVLTSNIEDPGERSRWLAADAEDLSIEERKKE